MLAEAQDEQDLYYSVHSWTNSLFLVVNAYIGLISKDTALAICWIGQSSSSNQQLSALESKRFCRRADFLHFYLLNMDKQNLQSLNS